MRARMVWLTVLVIGAAACSSPLDLSGGDRQVCTAIGCVNAVSFAVTGAGLGPDGGRIVAEACFDGDCARTRYTQEPSGASQATGRRMDVLVESDRVQILLHLPDADYDEATAHEVSLVLRVDGGEPIRVEREVNLDSSQPNGPNCAPVCWGARVDHSV